MTGHWSRRVELQDEIEAKQCQGGCRDDGKKPPEASFRRPVGAPSPVKLGRTTCADDPHAEMAPMAALAPPSVECPEGFADIDLTALPQFLPGDRFPTTVAACHSFGIGPGAESVK